ncbi:hypothetical protein BH10PSE7_BH10PSE7_21760 [soil metagenome]
MDKNTQIALDLLSTEIATNNLDSSSVWKGLARLFLTCDLFEGKRVGWKSFHNVVVYRESNDFKQNKNGPNAVLVRAEVLSQYLADSLAIPRDQLCKTIGEYWRHPRIASLQPNNLIGSAFRSSLRFLLEKFGDPDGSYEEEVSPHSEYPGFPFASRSKNARIDVVARRGKLTVALISVRWRFRHDRVDVIEEAASYAAAARRLNPASRFYAFVGEFSPARLEKILSNCPPLMPKGAIDACVHFAPNLLREGLKENGRTANLRDLHWLIKETYSWK